MISLQTENTTSIVLANKKILLGITGSIAATKCVDLVKQLLEKQAQVKIVLTKTAEHFVSRASLKTILGADEVYLADDLFNPEDEMLHIKLARYPDFILIAPSSANFMARMSGGFADDLLAAACLASDRKIFVVPAMNQQMWHNNFTQNNLENLKRQGVGIIGPAEGLQACGDYGYGRMLEPDQIIADLEQLLISSNILVGKKVVITAGPTIEQIDAVRYISNFSSGKMGYAIAKEAANLGAEVTLISGPTNLSAPTGVSIYDVKSAAEMLGAVLDNIDGADIFVSCAAVADYTPAVVHTQKLKKSQGCLQLELRSTTDIVREVAALKDRPFVVALAAETDDILANAHKKLIDKNLDIIVVNNVANGAVFGSDFNQVVILSKKDQQPVYVPSQSKEGIARCIWQRVMQELSL